MSKFADKYNKNFAKFDFRPAEDFEFKSLKDLYNGAKGKNTYLVLGMYINHKSMYGDAPVIVSEDFFINLPKHLLDTVKEMLEDSELVTAINKREFGIEVYEYETYEYETNGKTCYSVNWVDM